MRSHRIAAIASIGLLCGLSAASLPFANQPMPVAPGVEAILVTVALCACSVTAFMLLAKFITGRLYTEYLIGAAYLYGSVALIPYLAVASGMLGRLPWLNAAQAQTWLWLFWQVGFVSFLVAYLIAVARPKVHEERQLHDLLQTTLPQIIGVVGILTFAAIVPEVLPLDAEIGTIGIKVVTLVTSLTEVYGIVALVLMIAVTRGRSVLDQWLIVALVASSLDMFLNAAAASSFSVGWYVSRIDRLLATVAVLGALLSELTTSSDRMAALATVDSLTGLGNRRHLDDRLAALVGESKRQSDGFSLLMLDIDHFKQFNDQFGHAAGDDGLRAVATVLGSTLSRGRDFAARYGGEEFVVVLPGSDRTGALAVAEQVRQRCERLLIAHAGGAQRLTVSIGVVTVRPGETTDATEVMGAADRALYRAKATGRNRVFEAHALSLTTIPSSEDSVTA